MCLKDSKKAMKRKRKPGRYECEKCAAVSKKKAKLCDPQRIR